MGRESGDRLTGMEPPYIYRFTSGANDERKQSTVPFTFGILSLDALQSQHEDPHVYRWGISV